MQLGDERQFVLKEPADFRRDAARIAIASAFPSQLREIFQRRLAGRSQFFWIFVAQLVEREVAAAGNFDSAVDCIGGEDEKFAHLLRRF